MFDSCVARNTIWRWWSIDLIEWNRVCWGPSFLRLASSSCNCKKALSRASWSCKEYGVGKRERPGTSGSMGTVMEMEMEGEGSWSWRWRGWGIFEVEWLIFTRNKQIRPKFFLSFFLPLFLSSFFFFLPLQSLAPNSQGYNCIKQLQLQSQSQFINSTDFNYVLGTSNSLWCLIYEIVSSV